MPEDLSIGKILREKEYGGTGLISEKMKLCMQNLMKERKQSPLVILQRRFFTISLICAYD